MASIDNSYSSYKLNLTYESGRGSNQCLSIRTPNLPLKMGCRTPPETIVEMAKNPEKYNLVSEQVFVKLIAHLAPLCRSYYSDESDFKSSFRSRYKKTEYYNLFQEEDLNSKFLDVPSMLYDHQWVWLLRYKANTPDDIVTITSAIGAAIDEFVKQEQQKQE